MKKEDQSKNNGSGLMSIKKSPLMIISFLIFWTLSLVLFGPGLLQIIMTSNTVFERILLSAFSLLYVIFWLLASYFVAVVLFYFISKPIYKPPNFQGNEYPQVAILYTTCNDFCREAAVSNLNQDYPNFHLYLLDDSNNEEICSEIDTFWADHKDKTTVIRRFNRKGFKPGALNNALHGEVARYPFFTVVDADEILPRDFLRQTIAYLHNSDLAFAQANHAPNPEQKAIFANDIGKTILPFWDVHCQARNRYGFVVYMGHGVTMRRNAWEKVGGFPEVITEDLAFSALLAEKGMQGIFLEKLLCYEDFPDTYNTFKKQHERYIIGTTQVICKYLGRVVQSRKISLIEKIDFLLWCSPLYIPALCLVFITLSSIFLAIFFGKWSTLTISIFQNQFDLFPIRILDDRFSPMWSMDFQIFSIFGAFSPAFASIALGLKKKLHVTRLLFLSTVPYLSLMIISWKGILRYSLKDKTSWPPTGERQTFSKKYLNNSISGNKMGSMSLSNLFSLDIIVGGILAIASLISFNIAFFAVSSCLLIGAYLDVFGWEGKYAHFVSISCFALILLQMVMNLVFMVYSPGLVPLVFSVHF